MEYNLEPCWVCGVQTTSACSPCLRVENRIFFCSRDCQKLVWKNHKRVCGKAKFQLPLLDKDEASYLSVRLKELMPLDKDGPNPPPRTLEQTLQANMPYQNSGQELLDMFVEGNSSPLRPAANFQDHVAWVRGVISAYKLADDTYDSHGHTVFNPSLSIATLLCHIRPSFGGSIPPSTPLFLHRLVMLIPLYASALFDDNKAIENARRARRAHVKFSLFDVVRTIETKEEKGREWGKKVRPMLVQLWGLAENTGLVREGASYRLTAEDRVYLDDL